MLLTEYDEKLHLKTLYRQGQEDGYDKANEQINKLYSILLEEKRMDDLEKAIKDSVYRNQLFEEYKL